jgi:hypothetical protein
MRSARTTFLLMLAVGALPLLVAACGPSSSASTSASSSTSTAPDFRTAAGRAQLAACLKKQGVTLPQRPQGAPPPGGAAGVGGGFFFGGGGGNGAAQGNSKFGNALRKCGVNRPQGGFRRQANSAQFKQAITKFVACMKTDGYPLPKPNTSGNGPVFSSSKVNRNDPKFKSAAQKCQGLLRPGGSPPGATITTQ